MYLYVCCVCSTVLCIVFMTDDDDDIDNYSAPVGLWSIVINLPVCASLCVSVCPRAYLWNRSTNLHKILYSDLLWPWLNPPLVVLRYVMYFRFNG